MPSWLKFLGIDPRLISSTCPGKLRGWAKFELCLTLHEPGLVQAMCAILHHFNVAMRDSRQEKQEARLRVFVGD
jgi:hypothetical protein